MQTRLISWGFRNGSTISFFPSNVIKMVNIYKQRCRKDQNRSKSGADPGFVVKGGVSRRGV